MRSPRGAPRGGYSGWSVGSSGTPRDDAHRMLVCRAWEYQMAEAYAIGLDLGGTDLKAGLVRADGTLEHFLRKPSRTQESATAPIEVVLEAVAALRQRAGDAP